MTTIKLRRGTAAQWIAANPVLAVGEPGYETDVGKVKIGNGTVAWSALPYSIDHSTVFLDILQASSTYDETKAAVNLAAFNTAVNEAISTGRRWLVIPEGSYPFKGTPTIGPTASGLHLFGAGIGRTTLIIKDEIADDFLLIGGAGGNTTTTLSAAGNIADAYGDGSNIGGIAEGTSSLTVTAVGTLAVGKPVLLLHTNLLFGSFCARISAISGNVITLDQALPTVLVNSGGQTVSVIYPTGADWVKNVTVSDLTLTVDPVSSRSVADVVVTNGSAVVTSATAAFTAADVGKFTSLSNQSGTTSYLYGATIASVQSATQATLSAVWTYASNTSIYMSMGFRKPYLLRSNYATNVTLERIKVSGWHGNSLYPLAVNSGRDCTIRNCVVENVNGVGTSEAISATTLTRARLLDNLVRDSAASGPLVSASPCSTISRNIIIGAARGGGRGGKILAGSNYSVFSDNQAYESGMSNGLTGAIFTDSWGVLVSNNIIDGSGSDGLSISSSPISGGDQAALNKRIHHFTIIGNKINRAGNTGINLGVGSNPIDPSLYAHHLITGNTIRNCVGAGVWVSASGCSVVGNTIENYGITGLYAGITIPAAKDHYVASNKIRNGGVGRAIYSSSSLGGRVGSNDTIGETVTTNAADTVDVAGTAIADRETTLRNGPNFRESFSRTLPSSTLAPTSGTLTGAKVAGLKGESYTRVVMLSSSTAPTWGTNGDGHWYVAVYDASGNLVTQTADQGAAALAAFNTKVLTLNATITPAADTLYTVAVMIYLGTGGTPVAPTLKAVSPMSAGALVAGQGVLAVSGTTGLTTGTAPSTFGTATSQNNLLYMALAA